MFLFTINIPDDTELPGVGSLTAEQAQSYTPLASDQSLDNSPPIDYPVSIPEPRDETMGEIDEPGAQSTTWPVANKEQPLLFLLGIPRYKHTGPITFYFIYYKLI